MARAPVNNEAFIREVDEEVRREQAARLARRYGLIVAVVVVLALAALAGTLWWRSHQQAEAGARGDRFMAAMASLSAGREADAQNQLKPLADSGTRGYAPLARMLQADMLVKDGKQPQAAAAFQAIADDGAVDRPLRDIALMRATTLQFDTLPPRQVIDRLKGLAVPGNPWFGSAGEMTGIAWMRLGQPKKAGAVFVAMTKDKGVPASLRARVAQLAADLGYQAVQLQDMPLQ